MPDDLKARRTRSKERLGDLRAARKAGGVPVKDPATGKVSIVVLDTIHKKRKKPRKKAKISKTLEDRAKMTSEIEEIL